MEFKGLLMTKVNCNTVGLDIPVANRLVEKSVYLKTELENEMERTRCIRGHKDLRKMKIELPKIKQKKAFPHYIVNLQKKASKVKTRVLDLDDPKVKYTCLNGIGCQNRN